MITLITEAGFSVGAERMGALAIHDMKKFLFSLLFVSSGLATAGMLPQLDDDPWTGWFAGYEDRDFRFGVNNDGEGVLIPIDERKDEPVSQRYYIRIEPIIEEVREGGRVVSKRPVEGEWEAITEANAEAEKISYRGKVTGGASFEVNFEIDGDQIRGGGRLLDKGELTEHPIRFALRVRVPNVYHYVRDEEKVEERAEGDTIRLERADGEKLKLDGWEPVWAEKDVSGPGIKTASVELEGYDGRDLDLDSGDGGLFEFWNGEKRPLYKGFTFGWKPDPLKDPEGKARFTLEFG